MAARNYKKEPTSAFFPKNIIEEKSTLSLAVKYHIGDDAGAEFNRLQLLRMPLGSKSQI